MHTYISKPRRSALAFRRRLAGLAAVSAVAVTLAAWGASGSAASVEPAAEIVPGAADRVIGNGTDSYAPVVARVAPAVVTVRSEQRARLTQQRLPFLDDPRFREFFGDRFGEGVPSPGPQPRQGGLGSGVIVNSDGYILTNHHVIGGADKVRVELQDRRVFDAAIVGSDEPSDLAVLKIEAAELPVVSFGDSELVKVGDIVLALGNPMGVGQTVTMGIISAKGRATGLGDGGFEDFLQTDAPINSGNSGGALVNTRGELVGINSQILSPSGGNIGIGFSIPVNMARAVMDALINDGEVRRGRLGVTVQPVTSDLAASLQLTKVAGALVNEVQTGSAADRAGIKRGDAIVALNGQDVADSNEVRNRIAQLGPDASVELTIVRNGETQMVKATLEALPSNSAANAGAPSSADERTAGLVVEPLTPQRARQMGLADDGGLMVTDVDPGGPAAEAGIRSGDVIRQVDGQALTSADDLRRALSDGDRPALVLLRRGEQNVFVPLPRLG
ncbi:MAG TPA: DegQ family serine endoprotease [Vicinamibacterales bacterium]|nr:DegQ family serine endoprotease [Vicinamibacterales bacterium]